MKRQLLRPPASAPQWLVVDVLLIFVVLTFGCSGIPQSEKQTESNVKKSDLERMSRESLFSMKLRCADQGNKFYAEFSKALPKTTLVTEPRFTYNVAMNTCLYKGGYVDSRNKTSFLYDLLSGEELESYTVPLDQAKWSPTNSEAVEKFKHTEETLFGKQREAGSLSPNAQKFP